MGIYSQRPQITIDKIVYCDNLLLRMKRITRLNLNLDPEMLADFKLVCLARNTDMTTRAKKLIARDIKTHLVKTIDNFNKRKSQ